MALEGTAPFLMICYADYGALGHRLILLFNLRPSPGLIMSIRGIVESE
jgi:hypothetical protein